jgi:hypothetical protein
MALEPRDAVIISQNSTTAAATIYAAEIAAAASVGTVVSFDPEYFEQIRQAIFDGTMRRATESSEALNVVQAFPGAVVQQQGPPPAVPAPQAAANYQLPPQQQPAPQAPTQQGPAIPAAQPGTSKADQAWQEFFANPSAYYDNRADKAAKLARGEQANGPDFKHKQTKQGLWLGGQYPAPQWVLQRFGMA